MNKHFFDLARKESYKATYSGYSAVKIGCVVVYRGTILARGSNSNKSHTTQHKYNYLRYNDKDINYYYNPSIHAEIQALNKIKYLDIDFSKVKIYIYRQFKNGSPAMARPCVSCMKFIKDLGIRKIYYTTNNGFCEERFEEE